MAMLTLQDCWRQGWPIGQENVALARPSNEGCTTSKKIRRRDEGGDDDGADDDDDDGDDSEEQ